MNRNKMMQYATNPQYIYEIDEPTAIGVFFDEQASEKIQMYMLVHREIILDISYTTNKPLCYPASACAEYLCSYLKGKSIMEAVLFSHELISEHFEGLEAGNIHSAIMVEMALKRMLADYVKAKKVV